MSLDDVLSAIDSEIDRIQRARNLLAGSGASTGAKKSTSKPAKKAKRVLSPEARKRIAAAQRKRWAAAKKAKR